MSEVLTKALVMLAKIRGTTVEYEVMRYNVEVTERRLLMRVKPALTEEERVARVKAARGRSVEKARLKRVAARALPGALAGPISTAQRRRAFLGTSRTTE